MGAPLPGAARAAQLHRGLNPALTGEAQAQALLRLHVVAC